MSGDRNSSRLNKYDKRRKNTKSLTIFTILGSVLLVVFIGLLVFGGGDEQQTADEHSPNQSNENNGNHNDANSDRQQEKNDEQSAESNKEKESDDVKTEKAEPSDDNVVKAYTGNWPPVGTEQTGPHTTNYDEGSQDRSEMRKAVTAATDLNSDQLIMWWISRAGDQKVVITVSDANETQTYRVYMSWVDNEGWKPTKVEELKKNDQKYRFE
ncbi:YrrS family protein [Virgibacillus siamensis]|uniref:YrrS family protein n=1 Tax=Virgibacillus siamensis TaxID=480071 RepID=UPI0009855CF7|nr:YrrS family protein [Virgibacillus siamensis]